MTQLIQLKLRFAHPGTADPILIGLDYLSQFANGNPPDNSIEDCLLGLLVKGFRVNIGETYGKFMAAMDGQTQLMEVRGHVWESQLAGAFTRITALPYSYSQADMNELADQLSFFGGKSGTVLTSGMASWVKWALESNLFGVPPVYIPHRAGIFYGPLCRESINEAGNINQTTVNEINQAMGAIKTLDSGYLTWDYFLCRFVERGATNGYNLVADYNATPVVTLLNRRSNQR